MTSATAPNPAAPGVSGKKSLRRKLPLIAGGIFLLLVVTAVVFWINNFLSGTDAPKKPRPQEISLVRPPEPPPPPPKPPEEKPPEVPKEEVKLDEPPPPQAEAPPAGADLGVDAKGDGSGDSFGLVGKQGGRDITLGGGNGSRFSGYLSSLQRSIRDELNRDDRLRKSEYKITVAIWLNKSGSVERFELMGTTTGNADLDAAIKQALSNMRSLREPPGDMPQPVKLRVSSR
ncbi:MAG TPA: TonB C-terminal domain-containing protein [Gallionella sp.]|nr:TonB C-terminal domain-containing protein [Gallionella sp.]